MAKELGMMNARWVHTFACKILCAMGLYAACAVEKSVAISCHNPTLLHVMVRLPCAFVDRWLGRASCSATRVIRPAWRLFSLFSLGFGVGAGDIECRVFFMCVRER
ncbi:unnamed protein product [Sphacelaria rigidula]